MKPLHILAAAACIVTAAGCSSVPSGSSVSRPVQLEKRDNITYSAYQHWYRSADVVDTPAEPVGGIAAFVSHLEYPRELRHQHVEGKVRIQVVVGAEGAVKSARILESGGAVFDQIVLRAVHEARWKPAMRAGKAVPFTFTFPVRFIAHA